MTGKPLTRPQIEALADQLAAMLDLIEDDELVASTATRYRLEGAATALDVVLGRAEWPTDGDNG